MFKAKIKAGRLREMMEIMLSIVDKAKMEITEEGIHSQVVDPAHVQLIVMDIEAKAFEEYYVGENVEIGIDIKKFLDILRDKTIKDDEIISLKLKDDFCGEKDKYYLYIKIGRIERKMKLSETARMSNAKTPKLNLPAKVVITNNEILTEIKRAIEMIGNIADHIRFSINENEFVVSAKGDTDNINLKIPRDEFEEFKPEKLDETTIAVSSLFSQDFVKNVWKPISCTPITLNFCSDYPFTLEYSFADGYGKVKAYQAPRLESD